MGYFNKDGKLFEREILHIKYTCMVIIPIVSIYMLIWRLFFYVNGGYVEALLSSLVVAIWISTLIMFYYKLPHFNIPYTYSKNKKNLIYIVDIIIMTFGLIYYFFVYKGIGA